MGNNFKIRPAVLNSFLTFGLAIGLMVSPDTLIRMGSFLGKTGVAGLSVIILTTFFYLIVFPSISRQFSIFPYPLDNFIIFFYSCVKYIAVIFIATSLLVTSGFVFNEVFLYWFPNFGFAFMLLGLLIGLQFLPQKIIYTVQLLFVSIPISGLMILIVAGFIQGPAQNISWSVIDMFRISHIDANIFFLPLLFFVGFDLGLTIPDPSDKDPFPQNKTILLSILAMGLLFVFWGYISLNFISIKKMLYTTIPHMVAARNILGNPGRWLMGLITISGSLAAIHAIFTNLFIHRHNRINCPVDETQNWRRKIAILVAGITIAGLMAGGMAGDKNLEIFTKSALILWLVSYALLVSWDLFIKIIQNNKRNLGEKIKTGVFGLILYATILMLIITDKSKILIIKFLAVFILITLISWLIRRFTGLKINC